MLESTSRVRTSSTESARHLDLPIHRFRRCTCIRSRSQHPVHLLARNPDRLAGSHPSRRRIQIKRDIQLVMLRRIGHIHIVGHTVRARPCIRSGEGGRRNPIARGVFVTIGTSRVVAFVAKLAWHSSLPRGFAWLYKHSHQHQVEQGIMTSRLTLLLRRADMTVWAILVRTVQTLRTRFSLQHHPTLHRRDRTGMTESTRAVGAPYTKFTNLLGCWSIRRFRERLFG